ncbi:helix-turn-helix domain-containing protein [Morganella morganii]|uniref:helix-turn-helix domain-containing protein n=1 Tax=Morganella morganii TaxID=582 RepID=UPI002291483F|nr:helix-turn-helix domain-containing protein [Morganella morganii]HCU0900266.1 helix-turn-helix domain-containing protein [Morganella morganii]
MSNKIQGYVWDACAVSGVKGTKLMIMVRLADFSSDEGISYPSVETLSRQIGAGVSTIRDACNELEKDGWLTKKQRRNGNRNASNLYFLNVDKLETIALQEIAKLKKQRENNAISHPPVSDGSESDRSENSNFGRFDPPDSGVKGSFHPPESGGDPSVNSKHDPSVNSKEDPKPATQKKSTVKFDPLSVRPENVSEPVWQDWVKFRKEIKKPLTETSCRQIAKKLAGHPDPDAVLCDSIANGWQGIFPERTTGRKPAKPSTHSGFSDKNYESRSAAWVNGGKHV